MNILNMRVCYNLVLYIFFNLHLVLAKNIQIQKKKRYNNNKQKEKTKDISAFLWAFWLCSRSLREEFLYFNTSGVNYIVFGINIFYFSHVSGAVLNIVILKLVSHVNQLSKPHTTEGKYAHTD